MDPEEIETDGGLFSQYENAKPTQGYQGYSFPKRQRTGSGFRMLEPRERQPSLPRLRQEIQARYNTLYRPRVPWTQPAYSRFLGSGPSAYPRDFAMVYGYGPRADHYYPGLTPREVILARSRKKGVTDTGLMLSKPLQGTDIIQSRRFLGTLTAILYEGYLPTNDDMLDFLQGLHHTMQNHVRTKELSNDSLAALQDMMYFVYLLDCFIREKNGDEKIQRFVHHSVLSGRIMRDQSQRLRKRRQAMLGPSAEDEGGVSTAMLLQLLGSSNELKDFVNEVTGLMRGMAYPQHDQYLLQQQQQPQQKQFVRVVQTQQDMHHEHQEQPEQGFIPQDETLQYGESQSQQPQHRQYNIRTWVEGEEPIRADGGEDIIEEMGYEPGQAQGRFEASQQQQTRHVRFAEETEQGTLPETQPHRAYREERVGQEDIVNRGGKRYFVRKTETVEPMPAGQRMQQPVQPPKRPVQQRLAPMAYTFQGGHRDFVSAFMAPAVLEKIIPLMDRLRVVLTRVTQNPSFGKALKLIAQSISELGAVGGREEARTNLLYDDANRRAMMYEFKAIIEAMCQGYRLDPLIQHIDQFQMATQQDWHLQDYLSDVGMFLKRSLTDPDYLSSGDFSSKGIDLFQKGRVMLGRNYGDLTNNVLNEVFALAQAFRTDPLLNEIGDVSQRLYEHLFLDPQTGQVSLKANILRDIRNTYLPVLLQTVRFLPLPRIEISDETYDLAFDNIVLSVDNVIPNMIDLTVENEVQISPRPELPDAYFLKVINLKIYQIQADLKNVEFAYRKKSFPRYEDAGLADIFLSGNGLCFNVRIAFDPNLWYTTLIPLNIDVDIDYLDIKLHDSGHDAFYKLIAGTLKRAVKKRICRAIEKRIFQAIMQIDATITAASQGPDGKKFKFASFGLW